MKNKLAIGGLLLATFLPAAAQAQDPGAPTITGETGLFSLRSGYTNDKGQWTFGVYYSEIPRRVTPDRSDGTRCRPESHATTSGDVRPRASG